MHKTAKKAVDRTLGVPMRSFMRYFIALPFVRLNYAVTTVADPRALDCPNGAIVIANHISRFDPILLMCEGWPYARMWPTAWHAEYSRPLQWPFMKLFSTVCLGSPSSLPNEERARRKARAMDIMNRILRASRHLLIFAEGGIGDGSKVVVKRHLSGVYELMCGNPEKPVLMVTIRGLEFSAFGRRKRPWYRRFFDPRRLPVTIELQRFDHVDRVGGPPALNERIERYFNEGVPLATFQNTNCRPGSSVGEVRFCRT